MSVIEVEDVSKMFRLGAGGGDLRDRFGGLFSRKAAPREKPEEFWALKDISFSVEQGESFGIIGHNGSGKSTLLKLITGIYSPTRGRIRKQGRLSALIEVGAGFHPDLTGRENVYLNGSVLGMKKREIDARFDDIVEFAELERFIDTPVKRYSSGMYMRLGFAVAAHVDPEIVLVDEVLAVGDESFQKKCMDKMLSLRREGKTVLFVSHGMDAIAALCQKVMLLDRGQMLALGEPGDVITAYRTRLAAERERRAAATEEKVQTPGAAPKDIEILHVRLTDAEGRPCDFISVGDPLRLECTFRANVRVENPAFGVAIRRADELYIYGANTKFDGYRIGAVKGEGVFCVTYPVMPLLQGEYNFMVAAFREDDTRYAIDVYRGQITLSVGGSTLNHGIVEIPHRWEVSRGSLSSDEGVAAGLLGPVAVVGTAVRERV